ncbi:hypothetical protein GLO73106DRAFT_00001540 [Gloeocapsa sp. PCC 73106]|nr:hypothetical protein GLO73106DRAFT_00001540 [Gloeocapsa sp. PCC 73106]
MIDHDRLFKELISTFFWEFITLFLPSVSEYVEVERFCSASKSINQVSKPILELKLVLPKTT